MIDPLDDPKVETELHYSFGDHARALSKQIGHLDELIDRMKRDYRHVQLHDTTSQILHNMRAARQLLAESNDLIHTYLGVEVQGMRTVRKVMDGLGIRRPDRTDGHNTDYD